MDETTIENLLFLQMSMQNSLNKYVLIDTFCVKKRVFYTFSVIFPCTLFESTVKFSVIFQLSCPCNITTPVQTVLAVQE